jgi:hypothetical protein
VEVARFIGDFASERAVDRGLELADAFFNGACMERVWFFYFGVMENYRFIAEDLDIQFRIFDKICIF